MNDDGFLVFVGIVVLIAAIFYVEPANFTPAGGGGFSAPRASTYSPARSSGSGSGSSYSDIKRQLTDAQEQADEVQEQISQLEADKNKSPYFGQITISSLKTNSSNNKDREYIRLAASRSLPSQVNITGWKLKSVYSKSQATIPTGTNLYRPNARSIMSGVTVNPGDRVFVSTGKFGINTSFRVNICSGYHEQFNDFYPAITARCPYPEQEAVDLVPKKIENEACLDYIDGLPRCRTHQQSVPFGLGDDCSAFLPTLNYSNCVDNHLNDDNFYRSDWLVFLGRSGTLWRTKNEVIHLLDADGKIVDIYGD